MKIKNLFFLITAVLFITTSCIKGKNKNENTAKDCSLIIYAAAGTRVATDEVCDFFEKKIQCKVDRNYASSGTLARQIANGADGDVFISANKQWIDFLNEKGFLINNSIHTIAGNLLAVIAPVDSSVKAPQFTEDFNILSVISDKIVIGDPAYVPVGKYTEEVFEKLGWFDLIRDKIIMAKDVSSVLHYIELGECDWGIVYYTEAIQSKKIKIIAEVPANLHKPIVFYVADIKGQKQKGQDLSKMFVEKIGQLIFTKHGFKAVEKGQ